MPADKTPEHPPLVLAVDDDEDILALVSRLLVTGGYSTETARSGKDALRLIREKTPPVVILDYMMPDISGLEVLRRAREIDPRVQVLIITGRGDEMLAATMMKNGAFDYFTKPFENRQILEGVQNALRQRRAEEQRAKEDESAREKQRLAERERKNLRKTCREKSRESEEKGRELETVNRKLTRINAALKESNRQISRLEETFHELFDKAGDGIIKVNLSGTVLVANRMAAVLLGEENLKGKRLRDYLRPESRRVVDSFLLSLGSGRVSLEEQEVEIPGQDGWRTLNLRGVPLRRDEAVDKVEILMTDVTEKKHLEKTVKKLDERAVVAGLSRHLSHLLLNSLTSAGGYLGKASRALPPGEKPHGFLRIVEREMARMEDVVRGYQDYVRIMEQRSSSLHRLDDLLQPLAGELAMGGESEAGRVLRTIADEFRIVDVRPGAGKATIHVDADLFRLAAAYLIRGAVMAALKAGEPKPVELSVRSGEEDRAASLTVVTLGTAPSPEVIAGSYRPWDHQMLSQTFEDWGLTIASGIAERHKGRLEINSTPEGTLYALRIPTTL